MRTIDRVLDFFFPPRCPFCGNILKNEQPVCRDCMNSLPFLDGYNCIICSRPLDEYSHSVCGMCRKEKPRFEHAFIPLIYKDAAKKAILRMKHHSHPSYAKGFAFLLAECILNSPEYTEFKCITFVPQNPRTLRERGYNQSELIAKELSVYLGIPCLPTLVRTDDGEPQHTLSAAQRRENVKKCYFKGEGNFKGTVLLVDDIYTTGATVDRCSSLLKQMGFDKVFVAACMMRTEDDYEYEEPENEDN